MIKYTISYTVGPTQEIQMGRLIESFKCDMCGKFGWDSKPFAAIDKGYNHKRVCYHCAMSYPWLYLAAPCGKVFVDSRKYGMPFYWSYTERMDK